MGATTHLGRIRAGSVDSSPFVGEADGVRLYWQVVLINGAVLCVATAVLVFGPVSVSRSPVASEALVLGAGLAVMLLTCLLYTSDAADE